MQRLFSGFPGHGPGLGLLIVRNTMALIIALRSWGHFSGDASVGETVRLSAELMICLCLSLGIFTPFAAGGQVVHSLFTLLTSICLSQINILIAGVGAGLMLIGPGSWSVDALLFGRRRIHIGPR